MKTTFMQSKETVNRTWYVIDAKDIPLGRVASKAATILRGKHKVTFTFYCFFLLHKCVFHFLFSFFYL